MLADLDDLILRVRNIESRRNIEEAVRVLRAGSPRSAIMLTWLAVVYDVIGKLRELEESGDAQAKAFREEYDDIRANSDVRRSQEFEGRIPKIAGDLELISRIEQHDFERLQEDRHRCAHPSLVDDGTPYQPSDELGRSHIRVAVETLLQFPPAQGKAALARVQTAIDSPYFPEDDAGALQWLSASPLARARRSLIRSVAVTLVKVVLSSPLDELSTRRRRALGVLWQTNPALLEEIAQEKLKDICASVPDEQLMQLLFLLRTLSSLHNALAPEVRRRLCRFVETPPAAHEHYVTRLALTIDEVHPIALKRLLAYKMEDYLDVMLPLRQLPPSAARSIIGAFLERASVNVDNALIERMGIVAPHMTSAEIKRFFDSVDKNGEPQVADAFFLYPVVSRLDAALAENIFTTSKAAAHFPWKETLSPI